MKNIRFTESPVISILKEYDGGLKVKDVCLRHGISSVTLFNLHDKYAVVKAQWLMGERWTHDYTTIIPTSR